MQELLTAGEKLSEEQAETRDERNEIQPVLAPTDQNLRADLDAYQSDYLDILKYRARFET